MKNGTTENLTAVITCPECGEATEEPIPEGACLFFWKCPACSTVLRPEAGDCCVFCSFGDRRCPTAEGEDGTGGDSCG